MTKKGSEEAAARAASIDALVDEASMDSFPASDPPSYWGRNGAETYVDAIEITEEDRGGEGTDRSE